MRHNTFGWRTAWRTGLVAVVIATSPAGCVKPTTLDPNANPGRGELDRLQKIVNDRPDLETVKQQLADLDNPHPGGRRQILTGNEVFEYPDQPSDEWLQ